MRAVTLRTSECSGKSRGTVGSVREVERGCCGVGFHDLLDRVPQFCEQVTMLARRFESVGGTADKRTSGIYTSRPNAKQFKNIGGQPKGSRHYLPFSHSQGGAGAEAE